MPVVNVTPPPAITVQVTPPGVTQAVTISPNRGPQGIQGPPGAGVEWEHFVALDGVVNGSNATFTTPTEFEPGTVVVQLNGVALAAGVGADFVTSGTSTVTMQYSPAAGSRLTATYKKA